MAKLVGFPGLDENPRGDLSVGVRVFVMVEIVDVARMHQNLVLEEELYREIIDIYRQPTEIYRRTGAYRHWFADDERAPEKYRDFDGGKEERRRADEVLQQQAKEYV